ncbi:isoprenylcysteine carboxylmethyltransferase family protein [Mycobacterium sp. 1274756.6]|uniref:methyltransferase family protein n=1 Tax=Mycobacterium sp. 1274756.6 TaxID=1834076 RepID=UPI000800DB18|nr:isoprenylcysteine carboxylmethyltransferase family protein [Mycobacterium sp. 1274756.6]OBJ68836.1 isoprenylcysteine carboxyl methyltransferase [Mycobacterium sp. 1274756.6]
MAFVALALYLVFAAVGFGWRSWAQYRRTGSTGFRRVESTPGALLAGAGFLLAVLAGALAPALQIAGVLSPVPVLDAGWLQIAGLVLAVTGMLGTFYAQRDMGESWRIGVDQAETTQLVRAGVFGLVRNPIFTAMLAFAAGIALLAPNPLALGAFGLLLVSIEVQVRVVEEPYLATVHGAEYDSYRTQVGRFLPGIG